jgi:hypothetical protein
MTTRSETFERGALARARDLLAVVVLAGAALSCTGEGSGPDPASVASVTVTPDNLSLIVGQSGPLTATVRDASGAALTGRTVTWASSQPSWAAVDGNGLVTGVAVGTANITATSEGQSGSATAMVGAGSGSLTGLDFPGNVNFPSPSPSSILTWNHVRSGTTPMAAYPATYIWRVYPRPNRDAYGSFWTFLFHARYQTSEFNQSTTNQYYGMHPYPDPANGVNKWEISLHGGDVLGAPVVFNRWYTQVAVVYESGGNDHHSYYWNWPNTTTDVVTSSGSSQPVASDPAIIIGDAPWNQGKEIPNAILRGFQFYDVVLTPSQIAQEIASPGSVRTPWYLNLNPTPSDVTDKSGNGHSPAWVGPGRPGVWTGP